jgi:hypothetical protein
MGKNSAYGSKSFQEKAQSLNEPLPEPVYING